MIAKLYDYFRSSASYRVRIAAHLKGIVVETIPVHLVNNGGEQHLPEYRQLNPQGRVPTWVDGDMTLTQSLAIIEYLQTQHPQPNLLGDTAIETAKIRAMAYAVACDVHPLNNLAVLQYLVKTLNVTDEQKLAWYHHWIHQGFQAIESQLAETQNDGPYCFGARVSLADICLIPQVYNAHRFQCDMSAYPKIEAVNQACLALPAFSETAPE